MSDLRRLLFANQTRAYEGYPLVISRSVALRYLKQYQIYGNSEQGVPAGYTPLEYIESTGTQYIIIPHKLNSTEDVSVKYMTTAVDTDETANIPFGVTSQALASDAKKGCVRTLEGRTVINRVGYGNGEGTVYELTGYKDLDTWYEVEYKSNGECYINGNLVATLPTSTWTAEYDFALFGRMTARSVEFKIIGRIASCKIGNSVNLIPAKRNSDGVLGMYDTVSGQFFTNAGTGTFTAGPALPTPENPVEVVSVGDKVVPAGYQELEYIESTGTQYIDTGYIWTTDNAAVETEIYRTENVSDGHGIYGNQKSTTHGLTLYKVGSASASNYSVYFGTPSISVTLPLQEWVGIKQEKQGNNLLIKVGKTTQTSTGSTALEKTNSIYLFSSHYNAGTDGYAKIRCKYLKLTDNGVIARNLVPAKRNSDGVLGMYDTVSQTFFGNAGSGSFVAGPEVNNYQIPVVAQGNLINENEAYNTAGMCPGVTTRWGWILPLEIGSYSLKGFFNADFGIGLYYRLSTDDGVTWGDSVNAGINQNLIIVTQPSTKIVIYGGTSELSREKMALKKVTLVKGDVTLDSPIPYSAPFTTSVYLDAPLRKVGDYADYIDYKKGQVIRNVGVKVLDGTESWVDASSGTKHIYYFVLPERKTTDKYGCCSHFQFSTATSSLVPDLSIFYYSSTSTGFRYDGITTLNDWEQYLAQQYANGTPVTVYYPLATPVAESIVAPALPTMAGSTTYTTETEVKPSNMKGIF